MANDGYNADEEPMDEVLRRDLLESNSATGMLRDIVYDSTVVIPLEHLKKNKEVPSSLIVNKLLKQLSNAKACKCGYFLAVTKLISIGHANDKTNPKFVCFPVQFCCRTFTPVDGDVMTGIVTRVHINGVFLKSGPMNMVYLSCSKMPGYHFVAGDNPVYMRDDLSKIGIGVVVRFVIFANRWTEDRWREFRVLASIDGDGLGPVSLNGVDELDFV